MSKSVDRRGDERHRSKIFRKIFFKRSSKSFRRENRNDFSMRFEAKRINTPMQFEASIKRLKDNIRRAQQGDCLLFRLICFLPSPFSSLLSPSPLLLLSTAYISLFLSDFFFLLFFFSRQLIDDYESDLPFHCSAMT